MREGEVRRSPWISQLKNGVTSETRASQHAASHREWQVLEIGADRFSVGTRPETPPEPEGAWGTRWEHVRLVRGFHLSGIRITRVDGIGNELDRSIAHQNVSTALVPTAR